MSRIINCNRKKSFISDSGIGEYRNSVAYLSEEILKNEEYAISNLLQNLFGRNVFNEYRTLWILGASYAKTKQIYSKNESKCGIDSCYRKSLNEKQICKPGKFFQGDIKRFICG